MDKRRSIFSVDDRAIIATRMTDRLSSNCKVHMFIPPIPSLQAPYSNAMQRIRSGNTLAIREMTFHLLIFKAYMSLSKEKSFAIGRSTPKLSIFS